MEEHGAPLPGSQQTIPKRRYAAEEARKAYVFWLNSSPFDCGSTVFSGLRERPNHESQANGALMRISPLGIFGCNYDLDRVSEYAMADAALTHPHPVCLQADAWFAMAVANAIGTWKRAQELYELIKVWAREMPVDSALAKEIRDVVREPTCRLPSSTRLGHHRVSKCVVAGFACGIV